MRKHRRARAAPVWERSLTVQVVVPVSSPPNASGKIGLGTIIDSSGRCPKEEPIVPAPDWLLGTIIDKLSSLPPERSFDAYLWHHAVMTGRDWWNQNKLEMRKKVRGQGRPMSQDEAPPLPKVVDKRELQRLAHEVEDAWAREHPK